MIMFSSAILDCRSFSSSLRSNSSSGGLSSSKNVEVEVVVVVLFGAGDCVASFGISSGASMAFYEGNYALVFHSSLATFFLLPAALSSIPLLLYMCTVSLYCLYYIIILFSVV